MTPVVFLVGLRLTGDEPELTLGGSFLLVGIPAYVVAWILGLPLAVAFRTMSRRAFWLHVIVGLLLGGVRTRSPCRATVQTSTMDG